MLQRIFLSLLFTAAVPVVALSAPEDRFHGGSKDGSAAANYFGYTPPSGGDNARFVGGGSGYDGYGSGKVVGYTPPTGGQFRRFVGGSDDGYAAATSIGYTPPTGGQFGRFVGGGYDGHANSLATQQSNPLTSDSDGDGIPDWWESKYYLSLAFADAATDSDGDGGGAFFEYMADTDPTDIDSRLAIMSVETDGQVRISFRDSSTAREYWIEASTTLLPGSWSAATSPPVTGAGGDMEISVPDSGTDRVFFRVQVKLP